MLHADKQIALPIEGDEKTGLSRHWLRFLPLGILFIGAVIITYYAGGVIFKLENFLKIVIQARHFSASVFQEQHFLIPPNILFMLGYTLVFILLIALSLPVALVFTLCAGFLFGWAEGALIGIFAKTFGSFLLFWLARYSFADMALQYFGERMARIDAYLRKNAFVCLLFLRFQPVFPFFLVNLAAALCGMKRRIFLAATLIGITPAACLYAFSGASLAALVEQNHTVFELCARSHQPSCEQVVSHVEIWSPQIFLALLLLALLTLTPLLLRQKHWFRRKLL